MPDDGREQRKAPRREVFGSAILKGPDLHTECIIRDLSATGARIEVSQNVHLPQEFNVLLVKANSSRLCILRWRAGNFAGVQFFAEHNETTARAERPQNETAEDAQPRGSRKAVPNNRRAQRRPVLGHCVLVAKAMRVNAVFRDLSETGAKLGVSRQFKLPPEFQIFMPTNNTSRRVHLRWQRGDFAGVEFADPVAADTREGKLNDKSKVWHV